MAQAYSDDLRRKVLEAYKAGEGTHADLAARFRVSFGWVKKISAAMLRTGKMERVAGARRGRRSRVTPVALEYLAARVRLQPDRTLEKLREDLERDLGILIGVAQLWTVLKRMGLRFKKSHSMPLSGKRPVSASNANSGANPRLI
jgi:transposase